MSTSATFPGPRSALDEGSVHDLWVDAAQVSLPELKPRPPRPTAQNADPLAVPAAAVALVDEIAAYGS